MARLLYTLAWWLALPGLPLRLWWRGRREPGYRAHVGERFGRYGRAARDAHRGGWWIHAVSVGETRAAAPLIERIEAEHPGETILLTCMTAAGRETGRALYGDRVQQRWLPYDLPFAVDAFVERFRPRAGLLMETELWPALIAACRRRGTPVLLVNARMSERSARGYGRIPSLTRPMLASLSGVAAQTAADAQRLERLGAETVAVTGNLKFDIVVPDAMRERGAALRRRFGTQRPVWLAASTREGEEALIIDALTRRAMRHDALLVLVPRHPQRFDAVHALLEARDMRPVRRSSAEAVTSSVRVVLGDTMGEMLAYCAAADLAFVGGSLVPLGGQNLIEPIAVGLPTLVGLHTFNFAEATDRAIEAGCARRVEDPDALIEAVDRLLGDAAQRTRMRDAALAFHLAHRGATDRLWAFVERQLRESAAMHAKL